MVCWAMMVWTTDVTGGWVWQRTCPGTNRRRGQWMAWVRELVDLERELVLLGADWGTGSVVQ